MLKKDLINIMEKSMQNRVFIIFTCIALFSTLTFGAQNIAGQKYYLKYCSDCHDAGNRGGGLASTSGWEENFKNNAKLMIFFHEEEPIALEYLKTKKFKKQSKKMKKFLIEFASDSPNIPSCNN